VTCKWTFLFPICNEPEGSIFEKNIETLTTAAIGAYVVDGGTEPAPKLGHMKKIIYDHKPNSFRGERIFAGLAKAQGNISIVVHPRSFLPENLTQFLAEISKGKSQGHHWGACTHSFMTRHWFLRWTSWYSNHIRGDLRSIFYLDHCWYLDAVAKKQFFNGPQIKVAIFEDSLISYRLRKLKKGLRLNSITATSAERFIKRGFYKQAMINQYTKVIFGLSLLLGSANKKTHAQINNAYEGDQHLNDQKSDA
jgi:hypothetical protein